MTNNKYVKRLLEKYDRAVKLYGERIFKTVADATEVYAYETMDHLRVPPAKSEMTPITAGTKWGTEYSNMWLSTSFTVPAELDGKIIGCIPDAEFYEVLCFKNGKPAGLINSKNRFIGGDHSAMIITGSAKAGETYEIARTSEEPRQDVGGISIPMKKDAVWVDLQKTQ